MTQKQYINEIVSRSFLPGSQRKKLRADLKSEIDEARERGEYLDEIIERMGNPDDVAAGIYENATNETERPFREFKSKLTLFGLPLVHAVYTYPSAYSHRAGFVRYNNGGFNTPTARGIFAFGMKAKGFVACGNFAAGFVAIGNITAGVVSIGNLAAGIFSLGNLVLAAFFALGNLALAPLAIGNAAFGYAALGNGAAGVYAVGNEASGTHAFEFGRSFNLEAFHAFINGLDLPEWAEGFIRSIEMFITSRSEAELSFLLGSVIAGCVVLLIAVFVVPYAVTGAMGKPRGN